MPGLSERLAAQVARQRVAGAVAGVSNGGSREYAAAGVADLSTGAAMSPDSVLRVASITKPVVATAVLLACRETATGLDRPVIEILPELRGSWRASPDLALADLLSHTSGLHTAIDDATLEALGAGDDVVLNTAAAVVRKGQAFRRGAAWQYCNSGFWLAGAALARLLERPFEQVIEDLLSSPLGLASTGFEPPDGLARGHRMGAVQAQPYLRARLPSGGLCSTAADLLRFAEYLLDDPTGREQLAAARHPVAPTLWGTHYGLGWETAGAAVWHSGDWGGYTARLVLVPDARFAAVALVNDRAGRALIHALLGDEVARATGVTLPRGFRRIPTAARAYARLAAAHVSRGVGDH